uniref:Uncharacterized protein LOC104245205 n=1 Tax=Nicotiana sylvestris TaxID=4096 RepID=A0A1U7Y7J0_NICSY
PARKRVWPRRGQRGRSRLCAIHDKCCAAAVGFARSARGIDQQAFRKPVRPRSFLRGPRWELQRDIANYLVGKWIPQDYSYRQRKNLISDAKYYMWDEPYLFKNCADNIIRRCVPEEEMNKILYHCHDGAIGGYYAANRTAFKVLEAIFFWPTLFKDA